AKIKANSEVVLLSPTGTGKTLAFLLPLIDLLDNNCTEIQVLIVVPSRELAIQIETVIREMGAGYKANAVYGGRAGSVDKIELKHRPAILVGTPGRLADLLRKEAFSTEFIQTLVLDEFDKSLEIGFENEMIEIVKLLPFLKKRVLTSATQAITIPSFIGLKKPISINYLNTKSTLLKVKLIQSSSKNKLEILSKTIEHLKNQPGIVFCNFKDTIQEVSDFFEHAGIEHGCFHGGMEQSDRERALIKFRNGSYSVLLATDLAARGIDIPELKFIIHYQLPFKKEEFTHRNGRTARMNSNGTAFVIKWENEKLPDFIEELKPELFTFKENNLPPHSKTIHWQTLYISGGRKDKISKGDIAGLFLKQGNLEKEELGSIELKTDCAYVAVEKSKANKVIELVNNAKLKTKKIRVSIM
ncbi:MAG: DEAD/DEAH box helicase, partial [Bacteroidia bacterium]|nr:DEAD/DEAH box helicase [Bacteroidia bacterium]